MGMLTIYCDDSGTSANNKVAVVAGYIGTVEQWKKFDREWKALLDRYGIKVMRRADLEGFHGEFETWTGNKRTEFVKKAHAIIRRRTYSSIGAAVIKKDFEAIMPPWIQKLYGGPYGWCAQDCIVASRYWCDEHPRPDDHIHWVFEAGTQGAGQIAAMLDSAVSSEQQPLYRVKSWTFAGKDVLPLHAADLIAYEVFKHMENNVIADARPIRASLKDLIRKHEVRYHHYYDAKRLQAWLDNWDEKTKRLAEMRPKEFISKT